MNKEAFKILSRAGLGLLALMLFVFITINAVQAAEYKEMEACWQRPTERESGAELKLEEIIRYEIWYNEEDHGVNWELKWSVPNTVGCVTYIPQGTGGEVCFNGFAIATNNVDPTKELRSKVSNMTCKMPQEIILEDPPKAPSFLDIMISKLRGLFKKYI